MAVCGLACGMPADCVYEGRGRCPAVGVEPVAIEGQLALDVEEAPRT
jgi:hypothetical protein